LPADEGDYSEALSSDTDLKALLARTATL